MIFYWIPSPVGIRGNEKTHRITSCVRNGFDKSLFVDDFGVSYRSKHMQAIDMQL